MNIVTKPYDVADPKLDLVLERVVDVTPELVWKAWTTPEHLVHWFTPAPWTTPFCEIDLRPGGAFTTVMRSPEGEEFPATCCYLEVVANHKLVWTNALAPGYRPLDKVTSCPGTELIYTAVLTLAPAQTPAGAGTRYTARVLHKDETGRQAMADMGFLEGWGTALDQLIAFVKKKS